MYVCTVHVNCTPSRNIEIDMLHRKMKLVRLNDVYF